MVPVECPDKMQDFLQKALWILMCSWVIVIYWGFPCGSTGKESTCNAGDLGFIPELGRTPGEAKGYLLQYSGLENPKDCLVRG